MGEKDNKISTIVLKVDLECQRCYKKIRKVLCNIQDKMDIKTISFDDKSNSVTISGPFDAEMVCRKLSCKASRTIQDMNIKGKESKPEKGGNEGKAGKEGKGEKPAMDAKAIANVDLGPLLAKIKPAKGDDAKPGKDKPKADLGPLLEKVKPAKKGDDAADAKPGKDKPKKGGDDADAPAVDAKPVKTIPKDVLEKMMAAAVAAKAGPEPPRGEPIAPPAVPVAQGVAVQSIWPAPASSLAGYGYNNPSSYGGGGYGYGCGCGYGGGYCQCAKPAPSGGYYGVPVYDNQGWHYGGRQPYYPQQQACCQDPNAGCSVM